MMNEFIKEVKKYYSANDMKYHTIYHVIYMFELYKYFENEFIKEFPDLKEKESELFTAIAWHDSVYIPGCELNEEFSAELYAKNCDNKRKPWNKNVFHAILSTKIGTKIFMGTVEKILHDLDWSGFTNYNMMKENEEKILYEAIDDFRYKKEEVINNQLNFYKSIADKDLYVTDTFKSFNFNEKAKENLKKRIEEMEKEK